MTPPGAAGGGDGATGSLTSPSFTVTSPYLNFKIGGGRHPHEAGTVLDSAPPEGTVLADFEGGGYEDWRATGDAFGAAPATGTLRAARRPSSATTPPPRSCTSTAADPAPGTSAAPSPAGRPRP